MQAGTDKGGTTGPTARQDPALPQVFGRYLLVQRLSRGGMGEIFLAKHGLAGFEKLAVIKKVLPHLAADAQFISRFVDEAQVAIKLQHVNVAQVFEVGRVADEYFLALEYVEGRDLRRTLGLLGHRKLRLPIDLALFIGRELANGLAYAHRRTTSDGAAMNLVHCDISPPNVLVSFEGETKVIDFGIAKSAMRGTATDPKMGFGKFGYMAPEQLIRGGIVDHRTDIYAAGVVLYELLTGQRLYEAGTDPDYRALAKKVAKGEHAMPSETAKELEPYDDLVATALRPKAEDRYQTAAEFRDAIQQALVAVNPTISTDALGAYMRDLFADEMSAQKEMQDRVAKTHLSDFQEQFHTQNISTVSFALAQLPLQASPDGAPVPARPRAPGSLTGAQRAIGKSSSSVQSVSASSSLIDDLALADGTGTSVREQLPEKSRTKLYVIGALLTAGAAGAILFAVMRTPETKATTAPVVADTKQITFEPIEQPPPTSPVEVVEAGSGEGSAAVAVVEVKVPAKHKDPRKGGKDKDKDPKTVVKPEGLTREAVGGKFSATSRLYEAYKAQNGMRLDREWNELATFVQFKLNPENLDDAVRRIDSFRSKMKE